MLNKLTPINFAERRKNLLKRLGEDLLFLPCQKTAIRNNDVTHPYRQDSDFYYVTGLTEEHALCLLSNNTKYPFQLFVPKKDKTRELWDGKKLGPEEVKTKLGADRALPSSPEEHFNEAFIEALLAAKSLYYRIGYDEKMDRRVFALIQEAQRRKRKGSHFWTIHDPALLLSEMRLIKTAAEIERLGIAAEITSEAHVFAMKSARAGMYEYEVEAQLLHTFKGLGAERVGYDSIVASGPNACTLHYIANNRRMNQGELLLIDAACEFDFYTADISRTFPIGGKFTDEQRDIYAVVLEAQKEAIRIARPGKKISEIHDTATEILVEGMRRLKILKGTKAQILKNKDFLPYYPHGTSHWLGMDVHDVGLYYEETVEKSRRLEPGMVFTVEPGLYFSPSGHGPARYKGIGIRIEDDILITKKGPHILTSGVPKEIEEVESLTNQG